MIENTDLSVLVEPTLTWYEANKRDLPWRKDKRSLSYLGFGDHVTANPCGSRDPLLRALYDSPADHRGTGKVSGGPTFETVGRLGLLQSRPQYAKGGADHLCRIWWSDAADL